MYTRVATSDEAWEKTDDIESRQSEETVVQPQACKRRTWMWIHICLLLTYTTIFIVALHKASESNIHGPGLIHCKLHHYYPSETTAYQ
jgi:hypothetical protein